MPCKRGPEEPANRRKDVRRCNSVRLLRTDCTALVRQQIRLVKTSDTPRRGSAARRERGKSHGGIYPHRRIPVHERHPSPFCGSGLSVEKSVPDAEPFETPHISGSYRLRRHFPRYCDVSTCDLHPYKLRILPGRCDGPTLCCAVASHAPAGLHRPDIGTRCRRKAHGSRRTLPSAATSWLS